MTRDRSTRRPGRVSDFDEEAGLGTVQSADGPYPFHCTQISDGTRRIPVGAGVSFVVVAGHQGRWEAADLRRESA